MGKRDGSNQSPSVVHLAKLQADEVSFSPKKKKADEVSERNVCVQNSPSILVKLEILQFYCSFLSPIGD
jgi:hypothetical protein